MVAELCGDDVVVDEDSQVAAACMMSRRLRAGERPDQLLVEDGQRHLNWHVDELKGRRKWCRMRMVVTQKADKDYRRAGAKKRAVP